MATVGNVTSMQLIGTTTTPSFSHIHNGDTLLVMFHGTNGGGRPLTSGMTFNGNTYTQTPIADTASVDPDGTYTSRLWTNVAAVTANVAGTFTSNPNGYWFAISLSGCDLSNAFDTATSVKDSAGTATSVSDDLASVLTGGRVIDMISVTGDRSATLAANGSQTTGASVGVSSGTHWVSSKAGSGSVNMAWTWTTGSFVTHQLVALKDAGAVTTRQQNPSAAPPGMRPAVSGSAWRERLSGLLVPNRKIYSFA